MTTPHDATATPENNRLLTRIARLLAPYKLPLIVVLVAVIVSAVLTSLVPFLTKAVFDDALFPRDGSGVDTALLWWLGAGMITLPLISAAIGIAQNYLTSKVGNSAMADLRNDLFTHLQKMELAFFTATKTGAIQSRLANDVSGVRTVLTDTARTIVNNAVTVTAALIAMIVLSWQLTVLTLILMPLFVWIQLYVGRRRQRLARRTQESLSDMTAITEEALSVSGILLAKVFDRSSTEVERYREENRKQTALQIDVTMTGQTFFAIVGTFFAITPALIYLAAGQMIAGGATLTAGTLVAFTTLQARLQMPLMSLMRVSLDVQTSLALFRRIFEYLDLVPAIQERPDARELDPTDVRGEVEFRDLSFRYPTARKLLKAEPLPMGRGGRPLGPIAADDTDGEPVTPDWTLRGISLRVESGRLAAIVGPSGAGKTTMTYLIPRFYDATEGAVLIDDIDVRDLSFASIASTVGMVTQEPYLFHGTIRDNIAYARPGATAEEIEEAARNANIHDQIVGFADGYDTLTGERGYRLSGGEKQRIAIARVFLMNPQVLILDEATSALDSETERLVQEALERATRNRTTIAIAHRLSTIQNADVIFGIEDGRLVEQGTHTELLARGGLYKRLYDEQFGDGTVEASSRDDVPVLPC